MSRANGWVQVPLGELCQLVNGKAFEPRDWSETGLPIIRIQNLNDATKPFNYWAGSLERQVIVDPGDVLLGWSGTPGTSFGAHLWKRQHGVLNQHIFRVDLDETRIAKEWAVPAINHQLEFLIGKAHGGVGLRHVKKTEVESLLIPLPPLPEQKRIVGILKKQLAAVDRARAAAEAQLDAANALTAAYLRSKFDTTEAASWDRRRIADFARTCSGTTPSRSQPEFYDGDIPWVKTAELRDGDIFDTEEHVSKAAVEQTSLRILPPNTLLIAMYGQGVGAVEPGD